MRCPWSGWRPIRTPATTARIGGRSPSTRMASPSWTTGSPSGTGSRCAICRTILRSTAAPVASRARRRRTAAGSSPRTTRRSRRPTGRAVRSSTRSSPTGSPTATRPTTRRQRRRLTRRVPAASGSATSTATPSCPRRGASCRRGTAARTRARASPATRRPWVATSSAATWRASRSTSTSSRTWASPPSTSTPSSRRPPTIATTRPITG